MKKILCIIIVGIIPFLLLGDIVPMDQHLVDNSVQFTNLNDFPEIIILGYIVGPSYDSPNFFVIHNNQVLQKGYKFNDLGLYWASGKYVEHVGIENIVINADIGPEFYGDEYFEKVTNDPNIYFITSAIDPGDFWVDDHDELKAQISEFEIAGFIGDEIVIYLAKQIRSFRDKDNSIQVFDCPNIPNLKIDPFVEASTSSGSSSQ